MISAILLSGAIVVAFQAQTEAATDRTDLEAYKAAAARTGRDPDAHVKLALWCEAHGLSAERTRQLAMAVLRDPSHALAARPAGPGGLSRKVAAPGAGQPVDSGRSGTATRSPRSTTSDASRRRTGPRISGSSRSGAIRTT